MNQNQVVLQARRLAATLAVSVLLAASYSSTQAQESSLGKYVDDSVITAQVKSALLNDERVSGLDVSVETFMGTVQLSGFVGNASEREKAAELAQSVTGVKRVENDIRIK